LLPQKAEFFSSPSELIFNGKVPIQLNIHPILKSMKSDPRIKAVLAGLGKADRDVEKDIPLAFSRAEQEALRDPLAILPQYSVEGGSVQLLLRLYLDDEEATPPIGLPLYAVRDEGGRLVAYRAAAVVDMESARQSVRLIRVVDNTWLSRIDDNIHRMRTASGAKKTVRTYVRG
jgi:hypothetical protein